MAQQIQDYMLQGPHELKAGECYFDMSFHDTQTDVPFIDTWVYIGKNLRKHANISEDRWYFQDAESYLEHGSFIDLPRKIKRKVFIVDKSTVCSLFTLKGLAEGLKTLNPKLPQQK